MKPLEETLEEIKKLKQDLSANLKEEVGHLDIHYPGSRYGTYDVEEEIWVVDTPSIPDNNKREAAKNKLNQMFDSSNMYGIKLAICKALGSIERIPEVRKGISLLSERLNSPDRKAAREDLNYLYDHFPNREDRKKVSEALRHSKARFWAHEYKDYLEFLGAATAAGTISALSFYVGHEFGDDAIKIPAYLFSAGAAGAALLTAHFANLAMKDIKKYRKNSCME